jgi:trimeric autotransporter adhesin
MDDPLDPANKYLYHSSVESPDMKNIYDGTVVTDGSGTAVVHMPAWFGALNTDFRYQLTTIGQPAQAWIASEMANGSFTIKTSRAGVKVSWQVTGIRQDAWANAHRIQVEVDKAPADQGHYIHPELFGHEGEPNIAELHHPRRPAPPQ